VVDYQGYTPASDALSTVFGRVLMHDDLFFGLTRRARPGRLDPNTDVFYDAEGGRLVVTVEVAGADPDSLTVAVDEQYLAIRGQRVDPRNACGSILQKEIEYGPFGKQIRLPAPVDVEAALANYDDGILTITLPLASAAPAQPTELRMSVRRIPV
jgi:HSP20 family molecular chaperone IbpA